MSALLVRWTEKLTGGPQAGRSNPPPPLAKVMGVGRQQQQGEKDRVRESVREREEERGREWRVGEGRAGRREWIESGMV